MEMFFTFQVQKKKIYKSEFYPHSTTRTAEDVF